MVQMTPALLDPWLACCAGRREVYAVQQEDGRYLHIRHPLTYEVAFHHLQGMITLATYVIGEDGLCSFAVYDSDTPDSLSILNTLQASLAGAGVISYPEQSRRGWHLWVFLAERLSPALLRRWLLPFCPPDVEFYPKQDGLTADRPYGAKMRLPLGIHRRSGERYPFVQVQGGTLVPLAGSLFDHLELFPAFQRVAVPAFPPDLLTPAPVAPYRELPCTPACSGPFTNIRGWCRTQNPFAVIGRYVALDTHGMGCCPFGWHHDDGADTHPSFYVYCPIYPNVCCWYCHAWQAGGSLFDFLRLYYGLDARDLWSRICSGAHF